MESSELLKYLKTAVQLEERRYILKNIIRRIDSELGKLGHKEKIKKPVEPTFSNFFINNDQSVFLLGASIVVVLMGIGLIALSKRWNHSTDLLEGCLSKPLSLVGWIFLIFFGGLGIFELVTLIKELIHDKSYYKAALSRYYTKLKEEEARLKKEREIAQIYLNERKIAFDKLEETLRVMYKFYSIGIIHEKYCDFAPVCSFYDYFSTGICSTLQGHEGAYNLYESELRMGLILSKLDDIIDRLDRIEDNQYMMYTAIKDGNKTINSLMNNTNNIAQNLKKIEQNSEISARCSEWAAQEAETLKWITLIK